MNFISSAVLAERGFVKTKSALRRWYLTRVKGYTVESVMDQPCRYAFGRLSYCRKWVLRPPKE